MWQKTPADRLVCIQKAPFQMLNRRLCILKPSLAKTMQNLNTMEANDDVHDASFIQRFKMYMR